MQVMDGISDWLEAMADEVGAEADKILDDAVNYLYRDIHRAFDSGGPGWKPLSFQTILKKQMEGAPNPDKILHEWWNMRNSIEIRDESKMIIKMRKPKTAKFFYDPTKPGGGDKVVEIPIPGVGGSSAYMLFQKSVGIFEDTAIPYTQDQLSGYRGARDPVSRGRIHEFGGLEMQTMELQRDVASRRAGEVIRTGRMRRKGLKGESEAAETDREIKKQRIGESEEGKSEKLVSRKLVYIPERSFLRRPFDRSLEVMVALIARNFGRALDRA